LDIQGQIVTGWAVAMPVPVQKPTLTPSLALALALATVGVKNAK
jgi:hypothetical protein